MCPSCALNSRTPQCVAGGRAPGPGPRGRGEGAKGHRQRVGGIPMGLVWRLVKGIGE